MTFVFFSRALLALICGALLSLAFPPVGVWPLVLALAPLILLTVNSLSARAAFWPGFFFGAGFFTLYLLWLPESFAPYSGGYFWFLYPPMIAVLGMFWGLVTFTARLLGGRGVGALWLLPALWIIMEWARTQGPFAFPWGVLGYLWVGTPLAQAADIAGVYGLSLLTFTLLSLLVSPLVYRPKRVLTASRWRTPESRNPRQAGWLMWLAGLLLVAGWLGYGLFRVQTLAFSAPKTAVLVQGSTDPYARADSLEAVNGEISLYENLTLKARRKLADLPELIVWPEGVVLDASLERGVGREREMQKSVGGTALITGAAAYDDATDEYFNSVYSLADAQVLSRYDKRYLVPFGEYFPATSVLRPVYRTVFGWFGLEFYQGRTPGAETVPLTLPGTQVAAYICYESVFPQVARTMVAKGAQVLVNISNDAWFGFGQGARQHFSMGNLRAIETRRYLLRDGNDGITALINPLGQVEKELPRGDRGALTVQYGERSGVTPYVRFGDLLVLGLALAVPLIVLVRRTKGSSFS